jgi:hypothetical protein
MTWHPRLNDEPAHAWFREQVSEGSRADNLNIGLLFVLDAHTLQRSLQVELPFETSGDSTVTAISSTSLFDGGIDGGPH